MSPTFLETLTEWVIGRDWVTPLPRALFPARNTPYRLHLLHLKQCMGRPPPPICPDLPGDPKLTGGTARELLDTVRAGAGVRRELARETGKTRLAKHDLEPGHGAWARRHREETLDGGRRRGSLG